MSETTLCRNCHLWHNPRLGCKQAKASGQAWPVKPGTVDTQAAVVDTQQKMVDTPKKLVDTSTVVVDTTISRHGVHIDYENRKKQMREYMAKRRAKPGATA